MYVGISLISLLIWHLIYIFKFENSIRAHVRYIAFETFQIELYRVVDYDSKWSTKFHNDCMLNFCNFTFKTYYDNFFNFLNSIRVHVPYRVFATPQIELYRVVNYDSKWSTNFHNDCMLEFLLTSLSRRLMIYFLNFLNSIRAHVRYRAFATLRIELYHVVDYDSK